MNPIVFLVFCMSLIGIQQPTRTVHITTSDAIDLARLIAGDEGYDVGRTDLYSFDLLTSNGKPFLQGYTAIGFDINGNHRNLILINEKTGQALDYNTCEIFDYPDLEHFQRKMISISKTRKRTAKELANDAGCSVPKVITKPVSVSK